MTPALGIDFGTTNTRVAHFDGEKLRMVSFSTNDKSVYQLSTRIAYSNGQTIAIGQDAESIPGHAGKLFDRPLKWALQEDEDCEIEGGTRTTLELVTDFVRLLRGLIEATLSKINWERVAVTIPVGFPPKARGKLWHAFKNAGLPATHFHYEPIAAMYAALVADPVSGTAGVFDWGGGSLDIATVRLRDGIALTQQLDGWDRGGTNFDRQVAEHAINEFRAKHSSANLPSTEQMLRMRDGQNLIRNSERAKIRLAEDQQAPVNSLNFCGLGPLNYPLNRATFGEMIQPYVNGAIARLKRTLSGSLVTERTLSRLFLSGGTCNLQAVREPLIKMFGDRLTTKLRLPVRFIDRNATGGMDDIGNSTAIGAALLAAYGAAPVFATAVGIRTAGGEGGDGFFPVFAANDPVPFDEPRDVRMFVSDASSGVARLLICEQFDAVTQPAGRLLRMIAVPIDTSENWVRIRFTLDQHLSLKIIAAGRMNIKQEAFGDGRWPHEPTWIHALNLGFKLPEFEGGGA